MTRKAKQKTLPEAELAARELVAWMGILLGSARYCLQHRISDAQRANLIRDIDAFMAWLGRGRGRKDAKRPHPPMRIR